MSSFPITKPTLTIPGLILWLDSNDPAANSTQPANNSALVNWVDKSGKKYVANQSVADNQPLFKTNQQAGKPGIFFDANNQQYMELPSLAVGSNLTFFVVSQSFDNSLFIEQGPDLNSSDGFFIYGKGAPPAQIRNGSVYYTAPTSANWLGTSANIGMVRCNGSTSFDTWKNGVQYATASGSIPNATVVDSLFLGARGGGNLFMTGLLFEVIIYNRALSDSEVGTINSYLKNKWGVA